MSLSIAFSTWIRTAIAVTFSLMYASLKERMGWRDRRARYNSAGMRNLQRERLKQFESRERTRRLTEIDRRAQAMVQQKLDPDSFVRPAHSTWDVRRIGDRGFLGLRKKRPIDDGQSV